jgi:hypothetical protein
MIEDKTRILVTEKSKISIVMKNYITGNDSREFRRLILKIQAEGKDKVSEGLDQVEDLRIKSIVISVNGSTENVLEKVLDLPADDYAEVIETVSEIASGLAKKKEMTSPTNTDAI